MTKVAITWTAADGQPCTTLLDIDEAADQVMKGLAAFTAPDDVTARALNRAKERAAQRLDDEARNRATNDNWLRGQSAAETAKLGRRGALGARSGWRE